MCLGFAELPFDLAAFHVKMTHFSVKILEKVTVLFCIVFKLLMHGDLCLSRRQADNGAIFLCEIKVPTV